MDGPMVTDTAMAGEARRRNDNGLDEGQGNGNEKDKETRRESVKRVYLKEATVTVDVAHVKDARAADIIKAVTQWIGDGRIPAVRPKQTKEYEITLESEDDTELLIDGLIIKGENCEVKRLQNRDYVVSFMHLPVYLADEEILNKLEGWGVSPISKMKRRFYPGTSIEDRTRYVKTQFPKEVASLPYSTKIEMAEGPQYFRVMHSHQVKTCRLCMSPDHVVKDCPEFKCFKCEERGHFTGNCNAVTCPDCNLVLNKCECWMEGEGEEEEEEQQVGGRVHERDNEQREDESRVRGEGPESNNNTEQQKECNEQDIQTQQDGGIWTQIVLTDSLQSALDTVELDDQRNKELSDAQQEGILFTQMDVTDSLQKVLDTVELNDQSNKEQSATKESEQGKENEETQGKASKRRRSVKVMPNLETAKKRVLKDDGIECTNKYELLKGLEEMD
ncbi:uncharacterized protein LOC107656888 [Sinocyclocheilus anshuiensis]|uniref:uncharacterized protein LOC107656888 n=1 Tax=Sinocyclocheilus anshuiensis TaxID=1608454 RepID=UPI0007B7F463|nr:PREDICTED: uncharacterized protein LOC107656888 [Sinocyclocheilus anshuiensis]